MLSLNLRAPGRAGGESFPLYVSEATLLTPVQVNDILLGRDDRERQRLKDKWMLCGDAICGMLERIELAGEEEVASATSVIGDHSSGLYVVLTHQLDDMQHRFVLPAYEPVVASFLESLPRDKYVVTLGAEGSSRALVLNGRQNDGWARARELLQKERSHSLVETVESFGPTVAGIGRLDTLPSLGAQEVRKLSLSVILPTQAVALAFADTKVSH